MTAFSDPVADMLTRIRNAQRVKLISVVTPASRLRMAVLEVLKREGYIREYKEEVVRTGIKQINIELKYSNGTAVINKIEKISKPGRRVYTNIADLKESYNGLGISILSTSRGVMADHEAALAKVGGEVICRVF
jgi:small subunit ribosomal protein S8